VALDDALTRIGQVDRRRSQVVELRYFGGLDDRDGRRAERVAEHRHSRLDRRESMAVQRAVGKSRMPGPTVKSQQRGVDKGIARDGGED
jgi:hypothetical protein